MFLPHMIVQDLQAIDFNKFKQQGYKAIAIDKDNTLTAPYATDIYPPFIQKWNELRDAFGDNVYIVSNSVGTRDFSNTIEMEKALGNRINRCQDIST